MNEPGVLSRLRPLASQWVLPVAAGAVMALGYPPFDIEQAGWLALIPLLFALEDCRGVEAFRRGYVAGLVFFGMTVWWTIHVTIVGTVGLIAVLALYFGVFAALFTVANSWLGRGQDSAVRNLAMAAVGSAAWVTLEWVRGKFLLGGFPWNYLGVSQHQAVALIQFASVTGVYGVSALVCFVNFAFFFTIRRFLRHVRENIPPRRLSWEFYLAMILVCAAFLYGMRELRRERTGRTLRLLLVQGNIPQTLKFDPNEKPMILDRYRTLTEMALAGRPDLIIWPESALPEPARYDPESWALITSIVAEAHAPLLTGTFDLLDTRQGRAPYNAALLAKPEGGPVTIYRKIHLVAFGEYVPWRKVLPFMKWLTPISESFERGDQYTVFEAAGTRFGAVICFEDTVPELYRRFVLQEVDFMVDVTNDAWFKQSPAAELHLANAKFRAVENRRPLVRATNNGVTCVVDECGRVRTRLEPFTEGSLTTELSVPFESETTFYTKHGDVFVGVCAAVVMASLIWSAAARRRFVSGSA